jgi:hypothetical protein
MKFFVTFLLLSTILLASNSNDKGSRNPSSVEPHHGINVVPSEAVIFQDLFNTDNSVTGLTGRGWTWINQDGGGTTATFTGNITVFTAYEGPDSGYCGQNYNGANGLLIDQWLISPSITVAVGDTLSFWYRSTTPGTTVYDDSIYVRLSPTGGATIPNFTINLGRYRVPNGIWTKWTHTFTISGTIRFAIQYYHTNGGVSGSYSDYWGLDLLQVTSGVVPVELTSFTANANNDLVSLNWSTATETNNKGFEVQRKVVGGGFNSIAFLEGKGTTTQTQNYSYSDNGLTPGVYSYRLKQVDFDGTTEYSKVVEVEIAAPVEFSLAQNYPNPFNPSTAINFSLAIDSKVSLKIFNILGQEVTTLLSKNLNAGNHKVNFDASSLNSGVYLYKIEAQGVDGSNYSSIKKMILTK